MTDTQAQEAAMPVIAYLRASKDGMPQWTEDCVCEDPVYPSDPDGSDEDCISMPMVRKADADAVIASQAARIAELESRVHTCGPTCSKAGCINRRITAEVEALRADARRYQHIRSGRKWPVAFVSNDAPEPLTGNELDAAIDAAKDKP